VHHSRRHGLHVRAQHAACALTAGAGAAAAAARPAGPAGGAAAVRPGGAHHRARRAAPCLLRRRARGCQRRRRVSARADAARAPCARSRGGRPGARGRCGAGVGCGVLREAACLTGLPLGEPTRGAWCAAGAIRLPPIYLVSTLRRCACACWGRGAAPGRAPAAGSLPFLQQGPLAACAMGLYTTCPNRERLLNWGVARAAPVRACLNRASVAHSLLAPCVLPAPRSRAWGLW